MANLIDPSGSGDLLVCRKIGYVRPAEPDADKRPNPLSVSQQQNRLARLECHAVYTDEDFEGDMQRSLQELMRAMRACEAARAALFCIAEQAVLDTIPGPAGFMPFLEHLVEHDVPIKLGENDPVDAARLKATAMKKARRN